MKRIKRPLLSYLLRTTTISFLYHLAYAHGVMTDPRQRGALRVNNRLVGNLDEDAPFDPYSHFPAGDKSIAKGAGKRSIIRDANNVWTPYEPLKQGYHWRSGVCSDELGKEQEHLKGGRYFYPQDDPVRVRTYTQGDVVDFESNIVTHHNGFMEFFICNIDTCGSEDISMACFRQGYCQQLLRAESFCDNGQSEDCGPIDNAYPGRWYLPCGPFPKGQILYGGEKGSMEYQLPEELTCDHCVIQWYWTSANTCNPPGVIEYFEGEDKPNWPDCKGQGGARGGYTSVQRLCEGDRFPEEYWQCADVRIVPRSDFEEGETSEHKGPDEQDGSKQENEEPEDEDGDKDHGSQDERNENGLFHDEVGGIKHGVPPFFNVPDQEGLLPPNVTVNSQLQDSLPLMGTPVPSPITQETHLPQESFGEPSATSIIPPFIGSSNITDNEITNSIQDLRTNFGFP